MNKKKHAKTLNLKHGIRHGSRASRDPGGGRGQQFFSTKLQLL